MMKSNERLEQLENLLNVECLKYENNCVACPYQKECDEYQKMISHEK